MRRSSVLRSVLFLILAFVLALAGGLLGVWQMGDHLVFRSLYLRDTPTPGAGIRLVDIEYPEDARRDQPQKYREMLGSALTQLAALNPPPRTVLIDIWISSNPAGAEAIVSGIAALRARGVKVYAAVDPKDRHGR